MSRGELSDDQLRSIARAKKLDTQERNQRKRLAATRKELYAAVADALALDVPLAHLARQIKRDRLALYRWRDAAASSDTDA